jgi:chemotaxis protein methyltransferase CheR
MNPVEGRSTGVGEPLRRSDYEYMQGFLRDRIGHELGEGKEYLVEGRLGPLAAGLGVEGVAALVDRLRRSADPALAGAVCEAMVTGETSFFRNASAFERLRTTVFPALFRARAGERRLRVWSAGCATGQEPYSVAMLLLDNFTEARTWDVRIVATDVSAPLLRQAERGEFSTQETSRGLDAHWLRTYFHHERHGRWRVGAEVRKLVRFERHNLLDPPREHGEFDVILVRNVLIYFADAARVRVFSGLRQAIRDDGYLFLGESETILGQETGFTFAEGGMDYYRPAISEPNFFAVTSY